MAALLAFIFLWAFFGIMAYGLTKELFRKDCSVLSAKYGTGRKYGKNEEFTCCFFGCFGFIGFLVIRFVISKAFLGSKYCKEHLTQEEINKKFCFVMPEEFKISEKNKPKQERKVMMSEVLRLISGGEQLTLDACDGKGTIAKATDVFSYIDPYFKNWGIYVAEEATLETPVAVYEMINNANFAKMFMSLNSDVSKLVLTQGQILGFVQKYRKWLRGDGWATFFLFLRTNELFVALVYVRSDGRLEGDVYRFGYDFVWNADFRHRLVVP